MKVIFVTGASRGFGRAIATEYIKNRKEKREPVHLVLMARTLSALESVRDELHSIIPDGDAERIHLRIECCEIDLASVGQTRRKLAVHLEDWISSKTSHVQLIHNAGIFSGISYPIMNYCLVLLIRITWSNEESPSVALG